jgi:hypothetical protein
LAVQNVAELDVRIDRMKRLSRILSPAVNENAGRTLRGAGTTRQQCDWADGSTAQK